MKNTDRSKRSRDAALLAALTIIARDGAGKLTLDAIARESGLSKGGLLHQFSNKEAVLKALVDYQIEHYAQIATDSLAERPEAPNRHLVAQLTTLKAVMTEPHAAAYAVVGALAEDPELLAEVRSRTAGIIADIRQEARDSDVALLRWAAARGLALGALFKMCPLPDEERDRLFALLFDDGFWQRLESSAK